MDIQTIPESFLGKVLKEFGIHWTHIFVISAVVLSVFGLDEVLDPSIWIIGIVSAFMSVYIFKDYISSNFISILLICVLLGALLAILVSPLVEFLPYNVNDRIRAEKTWLTLYTSISFGIPFGACMISYNKRPEVDLLPLPNSVLDCAKVQINQAPFFIDKATYLIGLDKSGNGEVRFSFELHFRIINRSRKALTYRDIFDPAGATSDFIDASIDGREIDPRDPDFIHGRGIVLTKDIPGRSAFDVKVSAITMFPNLGSELVGCYFPARELEVRVTYAHSDFDVSIQSMLMEKIPVKKMPNGDLLVSYKDGLLPFQGVRIHWSCLAV